MESGDETVIVFSPTIAMDKMDTIVRGRGDVDAGGDTGAVDRDDSGLEFKYTPQQMRIIKDPIHDFINFSPFIWAFIDTRHFQRLRAIKQLGVSYYVWAGASHNRFEHCIGVAHLAGLLAERLRRVQPELGITARDVQCVQLAGLCHDLGHGPWSHLWDGIFIPTVLPDIEWSHENASEMMFDALIEDYNIKIDRRDVNFVKDLIMGEVQHSKDNDPPEKKFLFDIVANKRNGIDVDKFDYIARDVHAIGDHNNFSASRLIESARVINDEICYSIKDANSVYELCHWRFSNHKRIYSHKTARAIEYMIVDALLAAEPKMRFARHIRNPKQYVYLTDDLMPRIEASDDPELAESRAVIDRIRSRDLYRCVEAKTFAWKLERRLRQSVTAEHIVQAAKALFGSTEQEEEQESSVEIHVSPGSNANERPSAEFVESLSPKHVIVDISKLHYGMKDRNPIDFVKFYGKHNIDLAFTADAGDFTTLFPSCFGEILLRIYTREARYYGLIQAGYRECLKSLSEMDGSPLLTPLDLPTPPHTEDVPSTPRRLTKEPNSRNTSFTTVVSVASDSDTAVGGSGSMSMMSRTGSLEYVVPMDSSGTGGVTSMSLAGDTVTMATPKPTRKTRERRMTPFTGNKFMSVPNTYVPPSPTISYRQPRRTAGNGSGYVSGAESGSGSGSGSPSVLVLDSGTGDTCSASASAVLGPGSGSGGRTGTLARERSPTRASLSILAPAPQISQTRRRGVRRKRSDSDGTRTLEEVVPGSGSGSGSGFVGVNAGMSVDVDVQEDEGVKTKKKKSDV